MRTSRKCGGRSTSIAGSGSLPDGNKRVALLLLRDFVERNGHSWTPPEGDPDETVAMMEALAASELDQDVLADWIRRRLT